MKIHIVVMVSCLVLYSMAETFAQQVPLSDADETLDLQRYPLNTDPESGVSSARIGEGQLYQMEVIVTEIPAAEQVPPDRHLYEEMIYILSGEGYTTMWTGPGEKPRRYNWSAGDMLSPTLNAWHQHFNTSSDAPARFISISSAPLARNLFHNEAFLKSSEFVFAERWNRNIRQQPEYTPLGTEGAAVVRMKIGHHIPNLPGREMRARRGGVLGITIRPEGDMAENHMMEWEVREYQSPDSVSPQHRHHWETIYYVMDGKGFAILQRAGESRRRINWERGDFFIVEANEYHELRPRDNSSPRFWQMKASGHFHGVGELLIDEELRISP